ncbi:MAG: hypothetical protein KAR06_11660 [Deltaproteobacteria bacterium]|nr:hypothetical protein [Deltaproteobacteria bacterium]
MDCYVIYKVHLIFFIEVLIGTLGYLLKLTLQLEGFFFYHFLRGTRADDNRFCTNEDTFGEKTRDQEAIPTG